VIELQAQCEYAEHCFELLRKHCEAVAAFTRRNASPPDRGYVLKQTDWSKPGGDDALTDRTGMIVSAQAFLSHVAIVSKILWPGPPKKPLTRAAVDARGAALRGSLGLTKTMDIASRKIRDHLEHLDERLHRLPPGQDHTFITMSEVSGQLGGFAIEFLGEVFDLSATLQEVEAVKAADGPRARSQEFSLD